MGAVHPGDKGRLQGPVVVRIPEPENRREGQVKGAICLALTNPRTCEELRRMLVGSTDLAIRCVDWTTLDPQNEAEVLVLDATSLEGLKKPLAHPDRVVLIAREEPGLLRSAWEAGVNSVVFDRDPLSTVVLAILSACLRQTRPRETGAK